MGLNQENLEVHEDIVKRVQDKQPDDEYLYELADLFKVFGDTTRIKILYALFESELCCLLYTSYGHKKLWPVIFVIMI